MSQGKGKKYTLPEDSGLECCVDYISGQLRASVSLFKNWGEQSSDCLCLKIKAEEGHLSNFSGLLLVRCCTRKRHDCNLGPTRVSKLKRTEKLGRK